MSLETKEVKGETIQCNVTPIGTAMAFTEIINKDILPDGKFENYDSLSHALFTESYYRNHDPNREIDFDTEWTESGNTKGLFLFTRLPQGIYKGFGPEAETELLISDKGTIIRIFFLEHEPLNEYDAETKIFGEQNPLIKTDEIIPISLMATSPDKKYRKNPTLTVTINKGQLSTIRDFRNIQEDELPYFQQEFLKSLKIFSTIFPEGSLESSIGKQEIEDMRGTFATLQSVDDATRDNFPTDQSLFENE